MMICACGFLLLEGVDMVIGFGDFEHVLPVGDIDGVPQLEFEFDNGDFNVGERLLEKAKKRKRNIESVLNFFEHF